MGKCFVNYKCPDTSQVHSSIPQTLTSCLALSGLGWTAGMAELLGKTQSGKEVVSHEQGLVMAATL